MVLTLESGLVILGLLDFGHGAGMKVNFTYIVLGVLVVFAVAAGVVLTVLPRASVSDIRVVELPPTAVTAPTSTPLPSQAQVGVYLSGAVINPGVYIVDGGSRLANVLLLAGGATAEADLTSVNLAAVVHDEDHWHIPERGEAAPPTGGLTGTKASTANEKVAGMANGNDKVNLNSADIELLKTLPGIGDIRAQAIVSYRNANGHFASVDGLLDVDGIGAGTVENIRELVTVE